MPRRKRRVRRKRRPQRKTRVGRKHGVRAFLEVQQLAKTGSSLDLEIYSDRHKIGELVIGRGSLFWFGRNRHKRKRIRWSKFAEMMDALAYGTPRRG
jgi:hypothetical protein